MLSNTSDIFGIAQVSYLHASTQKNIFYPKNQFAPKHHSQLKTFARPTWRTMWKNVWLSRGRHESEIIEWFRDVFMAQLLSLISWEDQSDRSGKSGLRMLLKSGLFVSWIFYGTTRERKLQGLESWCSWHTKFLRVDFSRKTAFCIPNLHRFNSSITFHNDQTRKLKPVRRDCSSHFDV